MKAGFEFIIRGYAWSDGKIRATTDHRIGTGDSRGSRSLSLIYEREPSWSVTRKGAEAAAEWSLAMNRTEGARILTAKSPGEAAGD